MEHEPLSSTSILTVEQMTALEAIAEENQVSSTSLISWAVDALIAEAQRHHGWLPVPKEKDIAGPG